MNHLDDGTARDVEKGLSHFCEVLDLDELREYQRKRRRTPAVAQGTGQPAAMGGMAAAEEDLGVGEGTNVGISSGTSEGSAEGSAEGSGLWNFLPESAYEAFTSDVHPYGSILGRQAIKVRIR